MNKHLRLLVVLMALAALWQVGQIYQGYLPELIAIRANLGQHGLWRSAFFHHNLDFANFSRYLNEMIPQNARVVLLPAGAGSRPLGSTPTMQFFLMPRSVFNCLEAACLSDLNPQNTVVILNDKQQQEWLPRTAVLEMYSEDWGIALLDPTIQGEGLAQPNFSSLFAVGLAGITPLTWLGLLILAGVFISKFAFPGLSWLAASALGIGLGSGLASMLSTLLWMLGMPINRLNIWVATSLIGIAGIAALLGIKKRGREPSAAQHGSKIDPWLLLFILVWILSVGISAGRGFSATDEVILWGAKARGIAADQSLATILNYGTNTTTYPLHLPLTLAHLELLFSSSLPAAKMLPSLYGLALLLLIYGMLVRWGISQTAAGLGSLVLATSPLWFRHSSLAYGNLMTAYYYCAGVLLLVDLHKQSGKHLQIFPLLICGWFLAATAWTRPEGLYLAVGVLAVIAAFVIFQKRSGSKSYLGFRDLIWLGAPLSLYALFWMILQRQIYTGNTANRELIPNMLDALQNGSLPIYPVWELIQAFATRIINLDIWGFWGAALLLLLVLGIRKLKDNPTAIRLTLIGLTGLLVIFGIYYLTAFDEQHDLSWWINTGFDRMLMPPLLILYTAGLTSFFGNLNDSSFSRTP